jgi:hypothetical protein
VNKVYSTQNFFGLDDNSEEISFSNNNVQQNVKVSERSKRVRKTAKKRKKSGATRRRKDYPKALGSSA